MKIKEIILKVLSAIGLFFSVVFYVLFKLKKDQNKELENEKKETEERIKDLKAQKDFIQEVNKTYAEEKKENEELYNKAVSDINNPGVVPGADLLRKLREDGKKRNSNN